VSVGVAVAAEPDRPIDDLIAAADRALYRAKRAGRDRVMAA
jgi:diguanylate cyclase (GGDEF)-like protein